MIALWAIWPKDRQTAFRGPKVEECQTTTREQSAPSPGGVLLSSKKHFGGMVAVCGLVGSRTGKPAGVERQTAIGPRRLKILRCTHTSRTAGGNLVALHVHTDTHTVMVHGVGILMPDINPPDRKRPVKLFAFS